MEFSNLEQSGIPPILSPCGNYFIVMNTKNLYIKPTSLDLKNYSQIPIKIQNKNPTGNQYPVVKFSYDSQLIAITYSKKKLEIWDIMGNLKIKIQNNENLIQGIIWTPNFYQLLTFGSNQSKCTIYNFLTETPSLIKNPKLTNENGCTFSKGQKQGVFTAILQKHNSKDCIGLYFTETWELINHIVLDSLDAVKIQFSANGHIIVLENIINFRFLVVDCQMGVIETYSPNEHMLGICYNKFSNLGDFLSLSIYDGSIHLINSRTWKPIAILEPPSEMDSQKISIFKESSGNFTHISSQVIKIPLPTKKSNNDSPKIPTFITEFSPGDNYLAVRLDSLPNYIFIWGINELELISVIIFEGGNIVRDFKWSETQNVLRIANGTSKLIFWSESLNAINTIDYPKSTDQFSIGKIEQGKNGKMLLYSNSKKKYCFAVIDDQSDFL